MLGSKSRELGRLRCNNAPPNSVAVSLDDAARSPGIIQCRIGTGLREQQPNQAEAAHSHRGQTPKRETAAEVIQDVARKRGAEGSADADCAADDAEPKVEPSGAAHDVRNNKRENDPENGGADAIEELHGDDQIGTAYQRKECCPQRKSRKAEEQQRPASPRVRLGVPPTARRLRR